MRIGILLLVIFFSLTSASFAWDGVDTDTGASVEIGTGNLVRSGEDIEVYDYDSGEYKNVEVQDVNRGIGSVEVETYDYESGEYKTYEMED